LLFAGGVGVESGVQIRGLGAKRRGHLD
jgi:hypothetical protein